MRVRAGTTGWRDPGLRALRSAFDRASASYDVHAVLHAQVRAELLERLDVLGFTPATVLDLGAGTGQATRALRERYRRARVLALDLAPGMLAEAGARQSWRRRFDRVCADAARLPLRAGSVDLVFSSLMLQWAVDLDAVLAEARRVLAPRGCLTFATFGPDTLCELRAAWRAVDALRHVNDFPDMHTLGDALVRAGLADPVMDVDRHTLSYTSAAALMRDLKRVGAQSVLAGRPAGLAGRARLARVEAAYGEFRLPDGRLPATYEVIYGQAWCPGDTAPVRARRGEVTIDVGAIARRPPR